MYALLKMLYKYISFDYFALVLNAIYCCLEFLEFKAFLYNSCLFLHIRVYILCMYLNVSVDTSLLNNHCVNKCKYYFKVLSFTASQPFFASLLWYSISGLN